MRIAWLAVAMCLPLAACGGKGDAGQGNMQDWVGKNLSGMVVETLDGDKQPLKDILLTSNGKPVIVNVWATWCAPCVEELPTLDALGKEGRYTVVAIATDAEAQVVKDYLKKQHWGSGLQVWFDPLGQVTRTAMGASGVPVTMVLDKDLHVRLAAQGGRDWDSSEMKAKIKAALK